MADSCFCGGCFFSSIFKMWAFHQKLTFLKKIRWIFSFVKLKKLTNHCRAPLGCFVVVFGLVLDSSILSCLFQVCSLIFARGKERVSVTASVDGGPDFYLGQKRIQGKMKSFEWANPAPLRSCCPGTASLQRVKAIILNGEGKQRHWIEARTRGEFSSNFFYFYFFPVSLRIFFFFQLCTKFNVKWFEIFI